MKTHWFVDLDIIHFIVCLENCLNSKPTCWKLVSSNTFSVALPTFLLKHGL